MFKNRKVFKAQKTKFNMARMASQDNYIRQLTDKLEKKRRIIFNLVVEKDGLLTYPDSADKRRIKILNKRIEKLKKEIHSIETYIEDYQRKEFERLGY